MRKLIFALALFPCIAIGQTTAIPDTAFEQALIDLGHDTGPLDASVPTANISSIDSLQVWSKGISDLTGIEDFAALAFLHCGGNLLTSLDVSNNTALTILQCMDNQLTSLDVSNNTALSVLYCFNNQLTSLNASGATALYYLWCFNNQLTSLDVSNNTALTELGCHDNQLTCLNVKNGNNYNFSAGAFNAINNPNLTCIEVDDATWSTANWLHPSNIDSTASFSEDCNNPCSAGYVGIEETATKDKHLLNITDLLGRPTPPVPNQILIYKYSDGSVEKRIQVGMH